MSRNVQLQILRGTFAQLSTLMSGFDPDTGNTVNPLQAGEWYFAEDTQQVFLGMPGFGIGYIQIGDVTKVNEKLNQLICIMEATRRATVAIATGDRSNEKDFDPNTIATEMGIDLNTYGH